MSRFDADYYRRFYEDPRTRVLDRELLQRRVELIAAWTRYLGIPVHTILDFGCGPGFWEEALAKQFPSAVYAGVEVSEYLCEKHGWTHGSVVDFDAGWKADLVICNDVLQYLDDTEARRAIANLAHHTGSMLSLQVLTRLDWEENCEQSVTDADVHMREGSWYRRELAKHFKSIGGGLFLPKDSTAVLFELEGL